MADLQVYVEHKVFAAALQDALRRLAVSGIKCGTSSNAADVHVALETRNLRLGAVIDWLVARRDDPRKALPDLIECAGGVLVPDAATFTRNKIATRLTDKELDLMLALYQAPGRLMAKNDLLQNVWGYVQGLETHTLETHIYRLRQKIEKDPANPDVIVTEANAYRLNI